MVVDLLAHSGVSSPMEHLATGLLLVLLAVSVIGGTLVGGLTRHGRPRSAPVQPRRETLQGSWTGGSWER
ncbi:MAG: hypothetical protein ACT4O0_13045 [Pseudonocardia sp.]|jgi:hypothetical protein